MSLHPATVWECRASSGNDLNGGGFVGGGAGTDYSQQNAAQLTLTDLATTGVVTTLTSATGGFANAMVDNTIQIASGTNFTPGFYRIVGFNSTNSILLDRAPCTAAASGGTGSVGGALATLGKLSGAMVSSNKAYCIGAFTSAATLTFSQTVTPSGSTPASRLIGYGVARGDGLHATLTLQTNTGLTGLNATGNGWLFEQIDVDCGSLGTSTGINLGGSYCQARACLVKNFTGAGIKVAGGRAAASECEVTLGTAAATAGIQVTGAQGNSVQRCNVHDNSCPGISTLDSALVAFNLVTNNSGAASDGIQVQFATTVLNNTVHGNGRDGIRDLLSNNISRYWRNNLLTSNGGFGATGSSGTATPAGPDYDGNAYWNNTSGTRSLMDSTAGIFGVSPYINTHDVILTGSPYVGPTTGSTANFALNNTPGAGAACRWSGSPGTWPGNTGTTGFIDMGAVQHQDPGGRGGGMLVVQGGITATV